MKNELIYPRRGYELLGACFEVYKQVGCGFTEPIYQESLEFELGLRGIPFVAQPEVTFYYKGRKTKKRFVPDFICYKRIILEIKALEKLAKVNESQVLNYLRATEMRLGILANFGHSPKLEYKRLAL